MKLSEIIAYKNQLDAMTPLDFTPSTHEKLAPILQAVKSYDVRDENLISQLERSYKKIFQEFDLIEQTIEDIKEFILSYIKQNELTYYQASSYWYQQESISDSEEYILDRTLPIFAEVVDILKIRLKNYSDWHYPGLIIRPGREEWINQLVACDPVYLVDQSQKLLDPAIMRFNDAYRRRLRTYVVEETLHSPILHALPDDQFGFCLVYNFFNYKPIEIIEVYINEIYTKLKPGGVLIFTFNDCDRSAGVELVERSFMCYTPGCAIIDLIEKIGYEVIYNFRTDLANSWLEIRKPGTLKSLRGGQSLAKILYKDEYYNYTKEQIENIKRHAADLNIASYEELNNMPLGHIVELIKQRTN